MESLWGRFGFVLKRVGVGFDSFWDRFYIVLGSLWGRVGVVLGQSCTSKKNYFRGQSCNCNYQNNLKTNFSCTVIFLGLHHVSVYFQATVLSRSLSTLFYHASVAHPSWAGQARQAGW